MSSGFFGTLSVVRISERNQGKMIYYYIISIIIISIYHSENENISLDIGEENKRKDALKRNTQTNQQFFGIVCYEIIYFLRLGLLIMKTHTHTQILLLLLLLLIIIIIIIIIIN